MSDGQVENGGTAHARNRSLMYLGVHGGRSQPFERSRDRKLRARQSRGGRADARDVGSSFGFDRNRRQSHFVCFRRLRRERQSGRNRQHKQCSHDRPVYYRGHGYCVAIFWRWEETHGNRPAGIFCGTRWCGGRCRNGRRGQGRGSGTSHDAAAQRGESGDGGQEVSDRGRSGGADRNAPVRAAGPGTCSSPTRAT